MKTEIYLVSFAPDAQWLDYALRSIVKFAHGFSGTTVVAPRTDQVVLGELCGRWNAMLVPFDEAPAPLGHLDHNVMKCSPDLVCDPGVDFFCHMDSDCIFTEPVTPEDYFIQGKPVLLIEEYARLGSAVPWKPIVDASLKVDSKYETMRRHPAVHYRGLYRDLRDHVERVQGKPFRDYVLQQRPTFPCGFCEFNSLGFIALTGKWSEQYHFIDVGASPAPYNKMKQFWSKTSPYDLQLVDGKLQRPIEIIKPILEL